MLLEILFSIFLILSVLTAVFLNSIYLLVKETQNQIIRKIFGISLGVLLVVLFVLSIHGEAVNFLGYTLDAMSIFALLMVAHFIHIMLLKGVLGFLSLLAPFVLIWFSIEAYCWIMLIVILAYHLKKITRVS